MISCRRYRRSGLTREQVEAALRKSRGLKGAAARSLGIGPSGLHQALRRLGISAPTVPRWTTLTETEVKFALATSPGLVGAAKRLGIGCRALRKLMRRYEVDCKTVRGRPGHSTLDYLQTQELLTLCSQCEWNISEISRRLGVTQPTVRSAVKRRGVTCWPRYSPAKEMPVSASELRRRYEVDGETLRSLAAEFGVSSSTVQKWLRDCGAKFRSPCRVPRAAKSKMAVPAVDPVV